MFSNEDNTKKKFKRRKRRRTNEKMKTIIKKIEKEIENQLDVKNEKNDFTTTNIEAILKEVIRDEEVKEMVRQTLHLQSDTTSPYEPKLTRAKIRELLKVRPDLSFPILWPLPTKKNVNFVSECLSLINEDYSENSSEDEEYKPDEDNQTEYPATIPVTSTDAEDSSIKISSLVTSAIDTDSQNISACSSTGQEENIGQRTRSKLPLTDTPLEVIEQAFIPPDITIDMYESECDNEDWANFIIGFLQPLDNKCSEPTDLDDDLDDPEYNILADEETVDREELRKDRAVEVPRKEVNDLITELLKDCDSINSITENMNDTGEMMVTNDQISITDASMSTTPEAAIQPSCSLSSTQESIPLAIPVYTPTLLPSQRQLLDQQMRQHIQLLTTNFLQFHKHSDYFKYAVLMKAMMTDIENRSSSNQNSAFFALNLHSSLKVMHEWEEQRANVPEPKFNAFRRSSKRSQENFSKDIMKLVTKSDAFLYPLLLPHVPFGSTVVETKYHSNLMESEEWLLAVGLEQFMEHVKSNTKNRNSDNLLREAIKLLIDYLLPCFTYHFLSNYVKKKRSESANNYIKEYFEKGKASPLKHFVIPVDRKPLFKQPLNLLPDVWASYVRNNYVVIKLRNTTDNP